MAPPNKRRALTLHLHKEPLKGFLFITKASSLYRGIQKCAQGSKMIDFLTSIHQESKMSFRANLCQHHQEDVSSPNPHYTGDTGLSDKTLSSG